VLHDIVPKVTKFLRGVRNSVDYELSLEVLGSDSASEDIKESGFS
jgi:hypothetical protein